MDRESLISELTTVINDYLKNQGLDFVDLIYRYVGRDLFLRLLVDKPEGGISLDECAWLNNEISGILDQKDILQEKYILEVSSPGIDRPLKTKSDFLRCINRKVRFFLNESINGRMEIEGIITKVEDDTVYIEVNPVRDYEATGRLGGVCNGVKREIVVIPLSKINKAKQIIS